VLQQNENCVPKICVQWAAHTKLREAEFRRFTPDVGILPILRPPVEPCLYRHSMVQSQSGTGTVTDRSTWSWSGTCSVLVWSVTGVCLVPVRWRHLARLLLGKTRMVTTWPGHGMVSVPSVHGSVSCLFGGVIPSGRLEIVVRVHLTVN